MGKSAAVKRLCDLLNTFVGGWSECALSDMSLGRLSQQPLAGFPAMYVQPYFTSPSFCVTETNRCADGVRFLHPFTMRTNARLVCLSMPRLKAGPHWVLKKAYRREWIGKQRGMWRVRNRKGSEFQWFWGFQPLFTALVYIIYKSCENERLTGTGSNLCVNAWQEREVMQFSCSTALSCFIFCLLSDCSIIIMAITTNWESARWGVCLLTQSLEYWNISQCMAVLFVSLFSAEFLAMALCFGLDFSAGSYSIFRMWPGYCCHAVVSCSSLPIQHKPICIL